MVLLFSVYGGFYLVGNHICLEVRQTDVSFGSNGTYHPWNDPRLNLYEDCRIYLIPQPGSSR